MCGIPENKVTNALICGSEKRLKAFLTVKLSKILRKKTKFAPSYYTRLAQLMTRRKLRFKRGGKSGAKTGSGKGKGGNKSIEPKAGSGSTGEGAVPEVDIGIAAVAEKKLNKKKKKFTPVKPALRNIVNLKKLVGKKAAKPTVVAPSADAAAAASAPVATDAPPAKF